MLSCQVIMDAMERLAPKRLAEEWDNPGLLVGSPAAKIERVLVCLDVTDQVVDSAIASGCQLVIAHHPLIFKPLKNLRTDLPLGALLAKLIKNDIAVFAAHTNLDIAQGGVNDVLAERLGLTELQPFAITERREDGTAESLGRLGKLREAMPAAAFAVAAAKALGAPYVRLAGNKERQIKKVALCSGSGAEFIQKASFMGADAYVTGDVRYHEAQRAEELGLVVIDAGHFSTEFPVVEVLAARLRAELARAKGTVQVLADQSAADFFTYVAATGEQNTARAQNLS